ncbi:T9SS type A sorting domain-containing protein [Tenacibaculum amylolyticum]|uniref:T9SS type A sorting domain-containing protein n=1 Tax=Tenacibaculum amylolyticum TaxID=104269 RepID=UPI003894AE5F
MTKTKIIIVLFLCTITLTAQNFIEKQLPSPEKLSSFFIGPLVKSTIHYGKKPSNFNGEILLFNHGYIDLNQLFFTNNTFYEDAYNAGYLVVFVATTRGEGMWVNGELLAESIDIITQKYTIPRLTIIAHSNGGKAAEVAMFTHHKKDKVKRVISLGTPFWGTYLADISQKWWFNWIWRKTGLNEGSATSTTYYCRDVVRPHFDNAANNQPEKFFILGGSGFKNGHTILAPLMFTSGATLFLAQGTNDGVTPYSSSLRPGGTYVFKKGEAKLDHVDIALGQYVWKYVEPILNTPLVKPTSKKTVSQPIIFSDYQIINSENVYDKIIPDTKYDELTIEVFHEKESDDFILSSHQKQLVRTHPKQQVKGLQLSKHSSSYILPTSTTPISIEGNSKFAAFIRFPNGPKMKYIPRKENNLLTISFANTNLPLKNIAVDALVTKTGDLYGNTTQNDSYAYNFSYNEDTKEFYLDTSDFESGTYSIHITGKHEKFVRSVISGFTIGKLSNDQINSTYTNNSKQLSIGLTSNLIDTTIELKNTSSNDQIHEVTVAVHNLNGELSIQKEIKNYNGSFILSEKVASLAKGLYILTVRNKQRKKSFKFIKK